MKTLYLLRHAKSSWDDRSLADRERPLNERGRQSAPKMGKRFRDRGESIDLILTSPANRAATTAELFADTCGYAADNIEIAEDLYFSGRGSIEALIRAQDDSVESLMLVFHNPDITSLANSLDYNLYIDNVPTAGLVCFSCGIGKWSDFDRDITRFEYFDYPKNASDDVQRF